MNCQKSVFSLSKHMHTKHNNLWKLWLNGHRYCKGITKKKKYHCCTKCVWFKMPINKRLQVWSLLIFEWEISYFSKNTLLQRELFLTMFYTWPDDHFKARATFGQSTKSTATRGTLPPAHWGWNRVIPSLCLPFTIRKDVGMCIIHGHRIQEPGWSKMHSCQCTQNVQCWNTLQLRNIIKDNNGPNTFFRYIFCDTFNP